ncbi:MAG: TIGR04283 family arsenosugar biosynthesis glycosyltransferase [Candidatus Omnitrophica bacterium]|nr:TIGR04283 family arsenosugar biosynthesis glycosyltransferase [Candidatus Omnitrophota bacterium]
MNDLSVVIPTLDEAEVLPRLLAGFLRTAPLDIVIADGGSRDGTTDLARRWGATVVLSPRSRARQMNAGAAVARGSWLWFLHADSEVPSDWAAQLRRAMADPRVVGGAFTTRIAAPGLRYRVLDAWGWVRPRLQRSFYGDQGIFVRRDVWARLGGFADLPACEDVELSERLCRAGRVVLLPGPLRTSARRWQQRGWWRTVAEHVRLAGRYAVSGPHGLAVAGTGYKPVPGTGVVAPVHLVVMAKAPLPGRVKTRLTPPLSPDEAAQLARAFLDDTLRRVEQLPRTHLVIAVDSPDAVPFLRTMAPTAEVVPQAAGDLGARMSAVVRDRLARGASAVLLIGSDHPTLPKPILARAARYIEEGSDQVVLGPANDGGYYLIGLTRPHPELFFDIPWSTPQVFAATVARAEAAGLPVRRLPAWYDVDTPDDLARLRRDLPDHASLISATRRWFDTQAKNSP